MADCLDSYENMSTCPDLIGSWIEGTCYNEECELNSQHKEESEVK